MATIRGIFLFLIIFLFCFYLFIAEIHADTLTAASCSYHDVSQAIADASPEDSVFVPAGNCTWYSSLTISKGISLLGPGKDKLTINISGSIYY
jgi:hypothetical protein